MPPVTPTPTPTPASPTAPAPPAQSPTLPRPVALSRLMAVGSLLGLIVLGLGWELFWAPTGKGMLALKVLPLTLPLAGLLKNRMYTYRWVSLMVWIYFAEGVVRTGDRGLSAWLAGLEIVLCLVLFAACALHVRWRLGQARRQLEGPPSTFNQCPHEPGGPPGNRSQPRP